MMNYNSLTSILKSGIENMNFVTDTSSNIEFVDWFSIQGSVDNNIWASQDSAFSLWFSGIDTSLTLEVNSRNGSIYSIYREEGTLYNYYKFLKIRWEGTSYDINSVPCHTNHLIYDVIFWDTGDISLHMIKLSNYQGRNKLTYGKITYEYTISEEAPDVTFLKNDSGFEVINGIINLQKPYDSRYLIRSDSTYYTIINSTLSEINVENLNSDTFLNFGVEEIPDINLLADLSNPEILYWVDKELGLLEEGLVVKGIPNLPQIVYYDTLDIKEGSVIEKAEVYPSKHNNLFAISNDGGNTWKYHDGQRWAEANSTSEGLTADALKSLASDQWSEILSSTTLKFRCALMSENSQVGSIYLKIV